MCLTILYIGKDVKTISSGADVLNKRNIDFLQKLSNNRVDIIEPQRISRLQKLLSCRLDGYTKRVEKRILNQLSQKRYTHVFLSQSLLGFVAKAVKRHYPNICIICCFHNIEKHFGREMLRVNGIRVLPFYFKACYSEKLIAKYCDKFLFLNKRDAQRMSCSASIGCIIPIAYADTFNPNKVISSQLQKKETLEILFVGSDFFANIEGIRWFIKYVFPYISGHLTIVGKGMDRYKGEFTSDRISVWGFVSNLEDFYYAADVVVMPIFSGSGMKTKTAEALMYGKNILGTKEAFEGYDMDSNCMYGCQTAEMFIDTFRSMGNNITSFNPHSRNLYLEKYSEDATFDTFKKIFQ